MENSYNIDVSDLEGYRSDFKEAVNNVKVRGLSDSAANSMWQLYLMNQQYNYDDQWWNEHDSPDAITSQLRALGYSDAFISQYLLGNGSSSKTSTVPNASGGSGSGAMEDMIGAANAMTNSAQSVSQAVQADTQAQVGAAQVENLKSQTNLNNVNAGLRPSESAATVHRDTEAGNESASNVVRNDTLNQLTKQETEKCKKDCDLTDEQITNYQLQNYWYDARTEAELNESYNRAALYFEQKLSEVKSREVMQADIDLKGALENEANAHAVEHRANAKLAGTQANYYSTLNQNAQTEGKFLRADWDFRQKTGVNVDWDTEQQAMKLWNEGKYEEARDVMLGMYKFQMWRHSAGMVGSRVIPTEVNRREGEFGDTGIYTPSVIHETLRDFAPLLYGIGRAGFGVSGSNFNGTGTPAPKSAVNPSSKSVWPGDRTESPMEYYRRVKRGIK